MRPVYQQYHVVKARLESLRREVESSYGSQLPPEAMLNFDGDEAGHDGFYSEEEGAIEMVVPVTVSLGASLAEYPIMNEQPTVDPIPITVTHNTPTIAELQEEKKALHAHLKAFEREFQKIHGRQVMHQDDILPVSLQYRRYKDLKAFIKGNV